MTPEEANNLVHGIFDGIFDSVTRAAPGSKPLMSPSTTVLSLMKPGMAIKSADFRNPWTPGNSSGSQISAVNTAALVDAAPKLSTLYTDSGNSISKVYGDIMDGVQVPAQPPNPAIEKQLQDAFDVLYRTVQVTDPDTGEVSSKTLETTLYRDYMDNLAVYTAQQQAYNKAYLEAQKTQDGRANWPMLAPALQVPVKLAYDKWRSNFADKVETAIAIQNTSSQNALSKAFNKAKTLFDGYGAVLEDTGLGQSQEIHRVSLLPSDWYSVNSSSKWTIVDTASGSFYRNNTSDFTSGGGSVGFSLGIFSIGGGGGHSVTHRHMSSETTNVRISFEYALVTIRRPWMAFHLLGTQGWNLQNLYRKGQISNGSRLNQTNSVMPLLPTSFVVVRKVIVTANWSSADYDFVQKQTRAGGGFSIGPFRIGGSYAHSSTNETFNSAFANGRIEIPGVQIIGWISQIVPYCPPA
ncbi:hypothetical protein [Stigmatella hybrida]|uniref:hypothetical protein n=1 Tax=Stigmatella hybrida TaxID=394097 RepID=UPI001CDABC95|nr:hypothetical protein [Stigmatella hybrida]